LTDQAAMQIDVKEPLKSGRQEHYSAKFDGKNYPTNGGDPRVVALTRVDDDTVDQVTKRNGNALAHVHGSSTDLSLFLVGLLGLAGMRVWRSQSP
jgi:hypothetical protein